MENCSPVNQSEWNYSIRCIMRACIYTSCCFPSQSGCAMLNWSSLLMMLLQKEHTPRYSFIHTHVSALLCHCMQTAAIVEGINTYTSQERFVVGKWGKSSSRPVGHLLLHVDIFHSHMLYTSQWTYAGSAHERLVATPIAQLLTV